MTADRLEFRVVGLPPAKNEAVSMLSAGHSHAPRVLALLTAARESMRSAGFKPIEAGPVGLEVTVRAPLGEDPWDATNYLGGIADVLEEKHHRGARVDHLGDLLSVSLYMNDRQVREVHYRLEAADSAEYTVRVWALG